MTYKPSPIPTRLDDLREFLSRELDRVSRAIPQPGTANLRTLDTTSSVAPSDEVLIVDATSAAVVVNLPPLVNSRRRVLHVKKVDATANAVTLNGYLSETIDGAATKATTTQYDTMSVVAGAEWHLLG